MRIDQKSPKNLSVTHQPDAPSTKETSDAQRVQTTNAPAVGLDQVAKDGLQRTGGTARAPVPSAVVAGANNADLQAQLSAARSGALASQVRPTKQADAEPGGTTHGAGAGVAAEDRLIRRTQRDVRRLGRQQVDWEHPERALDDLSQVDNDAASTNDLGRCGACAITAGNILRGPDSANAAVGNLRRRVEQLERELEGAPTDGVAQQRRDFLGQARETLEGLAHPATRGGAYNWTNADAQRFASATDLVMRVDESMRRNPDDNYQAIRTDAALSSTTVHQYRDLMWGSDRGEDGRYQTRQPQYRVDGGAPQNVDIMLRRDGHFVLGTGDVGNQDINGSRVVYDSMPQGNGDVAYSQAVDGESRDLEFRGWAAPSNSSGQGFDVDGVPRLRDADPDNL